MNIKEQMVKITEHTAAKLKVSEQVTLQAIQIVNVLDHYHHLEIAKIVEKEVRKMNYLVFAVLSLCGQLFQEKPPGIRHIAKILHCQHLNNQLKQQLQNRINLSDIVQQIRVWKGKVMFWLKWKLAIPLLYDEIMNIANDWDEHTTFLIDFPLSFQVHSGITSNQNMIFLINTTKICLYNLNHLIGNTPFNNISTKIRKLSLALFMVLIRRLMVGKVQLNEYVLSPRYSILKILEDFIKQKYDFELSSLDVQIRAVQKTLQNYHIFRQKSRQKIRENHKNKKKTYKQRSSKQIEQKQNIGYYVNRKVKKSQGIYQNTQKYKSRSRSKKQRQSNGKEGVSYDLKEQYHTYNNSAHNTCYHFQKNTYAVKGKQTCLKLTNAKKSSSTKSIQYKPITTVKKQKLESQRQTKPSHNHQSKLSKLSKGTLASCKSKISRRSDKSQLHSQLANEQSTVSKCVYGNRSTLGKIDKKSTNSSIRMKLR